MNENIKKFYSRELAILEMNKERLGVLICQLTKLKK